MTILIPLSLKAQDSASAGASDVVFLIRNNVRGYWITEEIFKDYIRLQQFELTATENEKLYLQTIELYKTKVNIYYSLSTEYDKAIADFKKQQTLNQVLRVTTEIGFITAGIAIAGLVGVIAINQIMR